MKTKTSPSTLFVFLIGIAFGIVIIFLCWVILIRTDPGMLTSQPKTFGDIKIWDHKPLLTEGNEVPEGFYQECAKELVMTKDDIPFLRISQNADGQISGLYLLKNKDSPVLCLEPLNIPSKWGRAKYSEGGDGTGKPRGDILIDIDFDGRFDFKMALDDKGNLISRFIYIDGAWQQVDRANVERMKAMRGQTWFTFDPNTGGWQAE